MQLEAKDERLVTFGHELEGAKRNLLEKGGFQLEFVSISRVINHMTCYKLECSHWLKLQYSDWRANLVKDFENKNQPTCNEST